MEFLHKHLKLFLVLAAIVALLVFASSSGPGAIAEKDFVGKWTSSRSATPIYLYANGEWEIKADGGAAMQYGVWQIKGQQIIWSDIQRGNLEHDPDPVVYVKPNEFQVIEQDGSHTTFTRIEPENPN
ncbi:MAG: hypothetical protein PHQ60_02595 [Sideroxydans sp.]|nr:hypothetical protein [Sideroxydans sp.]